MGITCGKPTLQGPALRRITQYHETPKLTFKGSTSKQVANFNKTTYAKEN